MNDTTAIDTTASAGAAASTQVMPTGREAALARSADVRAYVTAVRSWLADLPGDEVEDLTAGMEADLGERAAETGERLGVLLGEPEAYAAELRSAAGLPPRAALSTPAPARGPGLIEVAWASARAVGDGILTRWPWLRELRPTWWLARGAALGWLVVLMLGTGQTVLLPLIGAAVSLWLGMRLRGREPLRPAAGLFVGATNVLAVLALLPMATTYTSGFSGGYDGEPGATYFPSEAAANGEPLRNVYAYDAAGNRLDGVRLFDQAGRPIVVDQNQLFGDGFAGVPIREEDGAPDVALDVFPLRWPGHDAWTGIGMPWTPPLVLEPVPGAIAPGAPLQSATPSPSASLSPSPSASGSPSPSASGSPSPSPSASPTVTP